MAKSGSCVPASGCSFARVFLTLSALSALGGGGAFLVQPDVVVKLMRQYMLESFEAPPEVCQILGVLMVGWGVGKAATVLCGVDEAITIFCSLNLVPVAILLVCCLPPDGQPALPAALLLCYIVCAATGPRTQEGEPSAWIAGTVFLFLSATLMTVEAVVFLVYPKWALSNSGFEDVDSTTGMLLGAAALGWAVGKWSCIYNGDDAMFLFCKLNLLPMLAGITISAAQHNTNDCTLYLCFFLGYLFLALTGPPVAEGDVESQLPRVSLNQGRYGHMNTKHPDTSKLPYVAQRRPSFEFVDAAFGERKGSKETASASLKEPLIDTGALTDPVRQVSTSSTSSGKFASVSRIPSKEASASRKDQLKPAQRPDFHLLKA